MAIYVRGSNPIWSMVDLTGHQFDDTFYMFVLENTLPYIPATVYHTPSGIPWTQPIQFLANGTLPVDIFWDPDKVYRLEFRQGNTQSDPLIYEVDNYFPGSGGDIPVDTTAIATDNQITNPQFSLISFNSPFSLTATNPDPIEVAPGWFLNLTGTGTVTLTRVALTSTQPTASNAPYALRITLTGTWTGTPYLSQRFNENGMLWSTFNQPRYVSNSITARVEGAIQNISAQLVDSMGTPLTTVLNSTPITDSYNEYDDHGLMPVTTNTDTPPDAWIEYRLFLPTTVDIFLTSIQLVTSNSINNFQYIQDTIERQQDYTFHYYRESLLRQQKECVLTGWDFGLNPWQFYNVGSTNLATFGYTADQTIMVQQAYVASASGNNISTTRGSVAQNYGFLVGAQAATNQFAMIQYIDPATIRTGWGGVFSSLVKLVAQLQNPALALRLKMKLIYRSGLPPTLSQTQPIASWAASGEPVFAAGWTAITSNNDPVYNIVNGANTLLFEGFELPLSNNANMTLGIVIYTLDSMLSSGTPDNMLFNKVSLVQNDFAIDTQSLTFDETLRRCEYYYEKSYNVDTPLFTNTVASSLTAEMLPVFSAGDISLISRQFGFTYRTVKRTTTPNSDIIAVDGNTNRVTGFIFKAGAQIASTNIALNSNWNIAINGQKALSFTPQNANNLLSITTADSANKEAFIRFHYFIDARLGL